MENLILNITNIFSVLAIGGVLVVLFALYRNIRARAWLPFIMAWIYVLFVRGWIMIKSLWEGSPQYSFNLINILMGMGYIFLFIGFLGMVMSLRRVLREMTVKEKRDQK